MTARWKRVVSAVLVISACAGLLTGCWDSKELDALFIASGVALDVADDPEQTDITLQAAQIKQSDSGSGKNSASENAAVLLRTTDQTLAGALTNLNRDSDHELLLQHNRALLFGSELAERGVQKYIDFFLRDQQSRPELTLLVVDGRAEEALTAKLTQQPVSGIFLAGMMEDASAMSVHFRVRLIDFTSMLLDKTTAPVIPIIQVTGEGEEQEIKLTGMAVFKGDRMIGRLDNAYTINYMWMMGHVERCNMDAVDPWGNKAAYHITKLDCKRDVMLREDGGVDVTLTVKAMLSVSELQGFADFKIRELLPYLATLAQDTIEKGIIDCFHEAQAMDADIFGFGTSVYRKYPKEWKAMEDRWDEIFKGINLSVKADVHIPGTGQIVQPLECEETENAN